MRAALTTVFARSMPWRLARSRTKARSARASVLRRLVAERFQELQQRRPVVVQGRRRDAAMRLHPVAKLDEQPGFGKGRSTRCGGCDLPRHGQERDKAARPTKRWLKEPLG